MIKRTPIFACLVLIIALLLIPPVSSSMTQYYSESLNYTTTASSSVSLSYNTANPAVQNGQLMIYINGVSNLNNVRSISASAVYVAFSDPNSNTGSYSSPVDLVYNGAKIGTADISFQFITNTTSTWPAVTGTTGGSLYYVELDDITLNSAQTGTAFATVSICASGQTSTTLSNLIPGSHISGVNQNQRTGYVTFAPYGTILPTDKAILGVPGDAYAIRAIDSAYNYYGHPSGVIHNRYYQCRFRNDLKIYYDPATLQYMYTITRNGLNTGSIIYNVESSVNVTTGTNPVTQYSTGSADISGTTHNTPITIKVLTADGHQWTRTYFETTYLLAVTPSSGLLTDTYVATVTSQDGGTPISSISNLSQYSLFENYGSTQYNLAKDPSGVPISYVKSGSNWTRYSGNSSLGWVNIGSTLPSSNNFVLSNDTVLGTTGTRGFTAELAFNNGNAVQHLYTTITLVSSKNIPLTNTVNFTVIDASTSAAIAGSTLSILQTTSASGPVSGAPWWNQTSETGKFSVSGLGTGGLQSLLFGDQIYAEGSAEGYVSNSLNLYIGSETIGSTQYIPLTQNEYAPGEGYFTAIYSAYDSTTSNAVSGVSVKQYCSGLTKVGTTNSAGIYSTYNNSAGTCSYTASKSGYTTITKSFTGTSQQILNIDIPMSASSINPTVTATTTAAPTVNPTATGAEGAQNAIDLLGSYAYTFMVLGILSVFMWLFWSVLYNMTGGNIITKIMRRGRR